MRLARALLVGYLALAVGLGVALLVTRIVGLGADLRAAALLFVACGSGLTYGNVRRHRARQR